MKKLTFLVIIFLASCAPSASAIATAIAQTQAADIATQDAAATATPTVTPTLTPTITPTITPTPDIRIVTSDPYDFLCKQIDLPKEGQYFLPDESWISGSPNSQRIIERGVVAGKEYVETTGRLMGWNAEYYRGAMAAGLPQNIYCDVAMFETVAGAQLAGTKYNYPAIADPEFGWTKVELPNKLGDMAFFWEKIDNIKNQVYRQITFSYRNMEGAIFGFGITESDVPWDFLVSMVEKVIAKIDAAPLSQSYTP